MAGGKQFTMKARPDEGKDRPPPERVRRGEYRIADGEDAGGSYAIDLASCPIDAALTSGQLRLGSGNEGVRWEAAKVFETLRRRLSGSPSQRSCLDFSPMGFDASDGDPEAEADEKELRKALGFRHWRELDAVCYRHEPINSLQILCDGLDRVADFYGIG